VGDFTPPSLLGQALEQLREIDHQLLGIRRHAPPQQVESIMSGPLEAIEATGANRLQTIVYAVIPQIVPPYISYTMYRWDINVRMSTIIGFVGGGGIGFLLQQNINLLNYRGASAQMVAIAVVVASMDYVSSVLREKTV
jgi:phosphonate transport system permease protein